MNNKGFWVVLKVGLRNIWGFAEYFKILAGVMRKIYYNEFDKYAVRWLKNLIAKGLLPDGEIDDRNILDVRASDIKEFTECHFFAGIGGWPYAMQLAEWRADRTVWTGSCPCQPFSLAGKQKGKEDERHLWPAWFNLIKECKPTIIFGEQVASAISFGWFDLVANDLEKEGYQIGAAILPACSVGAPHKRDRLWFVANAESKQTQSAESRRFQPEPSGASINGDVAFANVQQSHGSRQERERQREPSNNGFLGNSDDARSQGRELFTERKNEVHAWSTGVELRQEFTDGGIMGNAEHNGYAAVKIAGSDEETIFDYAEKSKNSIKLKGTSASRDVSSGDWESGEWIECPDGKQRLIKSDVCLLANGVPARVGRLRAYGNAIVPQVAEKFIRASMEALELT